MSQICRLCLKSSQKHNYEYISVNRTDNNGVAIATLVKTLIPEMYLGLSLNPVICQPCYDALRDAYSFRLQCLRSENLIGIYMRETRCSSMTIALQDVIDYWMYVYMNKQCQTAVARANLEEWFGLDASHIHPDDDIDYPRRKTKQNKKDERDLSMKTTDKKRKSLENVQLQTEPNKNIEKGPVGNSIEPKMKSNRDLIQQLLGNYRVEVEEIESDTAEEKSLSCEKQEAIKKVAKDCVPEDEQTTDEPLKTPSDSGQDDDDSQEACGCPPAPECPSSEFPHCSLVKVCSKGTHDECVTLCEFRHLSHCKYFRAPISKIDRNKEDASAFPTPVKTYAKKIKATQHVEDKVVEKPKDDVPESSGSLLMDEIDEDNLFEELQKCYNAGKFGFSEDFSNLKECFVLKKFYDKTDNSFSYALLPRATEDEPEGSSTGESTKPVLSLTDAYFIFKSRDLTGGQNPEENGQISANSVSQVEDGETKITSKDVSGLLELNNAIVGPSQGNPMPIIRVRPVTALQKIRTLNHELFPQSAEADRAREAAPAAPRTVVVHPVRHVPVIRSSTPPLVLNSTIVSSLKNALVPIKCISPPLRSEGLKTVTKTYSKPPKPRLLTEVKSSKTVAETDKGEEMSMELVHHVTAGKVTEVVLTAAEINAEPSNEEETIDIKEEPLEYVDDEFSNELQQVGEGLNDTAEWSGETTRSSSETSLMEKSVTENISQLIENIPDVGVEFDEPEYVHINKVSFADITKLVKESKLMKDELKQKIEQNKMVEPLQVPITSRRKPRLRRAGKRIRIVPISADDKDLPLRKKQRTLVKTVERTVTDPNAGHKDVCVLFTNFTSEGDYINDHDYLINPYMRNNMSMVRKSGVLSCACLLCNIVHSATDHIAHMKCHGTKCAICNVDFHNVFILNLHARAHVSYCKLCHVTVTYSRYRHHAMAHNRLLGLPDPADGELKEGASTAEPVTKKGGGSPNSPRRSRRLTRPINYEGMDLDEEEACIYDKATKSFLTPSVVKQEKLLEQCNDANKNTKTTPTKSPGDCGFVNLADLKPNTSHINVEFVKKTVSHSAEPKKTKLLYSGRRRGRYAKKMRAERPAETLYSPKKTETVKSEESSTFETEKTRTRRKKLDSESECDDVKEASITRRLSLRRRCSNFVPNAIPSMRRRRTRAIKTKNLPTTVSDLAAAVDLIISSPTAKRVKSKIRSKKDTSDGKLERASLAENISASSGAAVETVSSKTHEGPEDTREILKLPSSKDSRGTRSSRRRKNVNLGEGMEVHRLAKSKRARKLLSPAPAPANQDVSVNPPELPSSESGSTQSPSVVDNTTSSSNKDPCDLKPEMDQCDASSVNG